MSTAVQNPLKAEGTPHPEVLEAVVKHATWGPPYDPCFTTEKCRTLLTPKAVGQTEFGLALHPRHPSLMSKLYSLAGKCGDT